MGFIVQPPAQSVVNPTGFAITVGLGSPGLNIEVGAVELAGFTIGVSLGTPVAEAQIAQTVTGFGLTVGFGTPVTSIEEAANASVSPSGFSVVVGQGTPTVTTAAQFTETWGENTTDTYTTVTFDTRINEDAPTTNYGTADSLFTEAETTGDLAEGSLVRFTLTDLPVDATILSASIRMTHRAATPPVLASTVNMYQCLRDNWNVVQANWNEFSSGNSWTTAGARGVGSDVSGNPVAGTGALDSEVVPADTTAGTNFTFTVPTSTVQALVQSPSPSPLNLVFHNAPGSDQHNIWMSSRGTDGQRPQLSLTYTSSTGGGGGSGPGVTGWYQAWPDDGKFYDPDGNIFQVKGTGIWDFEVPPSAAQVSQMKDSWKFNASVVKVFYDTTSLSEAQALINPIINSGMIAIVQFRRSTQSTGTYLDSTILASVRTLLGQILGVYGSNPRVWYTLFAEPFSPGNAQATYSPTPTWDEQAVSDWRIYFNTLAGDIRDAGNLGPIGIAPPIWGQDWLRNESNGSTLYTGSEITGPSAKWLVIREKLAGNIRAGVNGSALTNWWLEAHQYWLNKGQMTQTLFDDYLAQHLGAGIIVSFGDIIITLPNTSTRSVKSLNFIFPKVIDDGYDYTSFLWDHDGAAGGRNNYTDGSPGTGPAINSATNPTNLSDDFGRPMWNFNNGLTVTLPLVAGS